MCFPDPPKIAEEIAFVDYHQKREGHPGGCPSCVLVLRCPGGIEAEAEFELRVLEDRDVVVVLVQHRCNVDAEDNFRRAGN